MYCIKMEAGKHIEEMNPKLTFKKNICLPPCVILIKY